MNMYTDSLIESINKLDNADIHLVINVLYTAYTKNKTIYIIGNGGSAAIASHFMNDLIKLTSLPNVKKIKAIALTDNTPLITAYANDISFDCVFSEQIDALVNAGDVVFGISTSGTSLNILNAFKVAHQLGATTIGLTGKTGGLLPNISDYIINMDNPFTYQLEDLCLIICHMIAISLKETIKNNASRHN